MCQKPQKAHPPFYVFLGSRSNYNKYDIIDMKHSPYTFTRSFVLAAVLVLQGVLASVAYAVGVGGAGMYQWSVELRGYISNETGKAPVAYLWVPEGCKKVNAVILSQQNMTEEAINMQNIIPFYDAHHCRYVVYWQK